MVAGIRIDVTLTDEAIYNFIRSHKGETPITLQDMAKKIGCHLNTAWSSTERLQNAGRIKKIGSRGRGGIRYEVI